LFTCSLPMLFFFISRFPPLHLIECVYRDFKTSRWEPAFSYHLGLERLALC
jgi:hypothetical protein